MRIISGLFRGRRLYSFEGDSIRPTTDRVKESMFNLISDYISGSDVLDLFSGSGALSLEALSRGANSAVMVDIDPKSIAVIKKNIELVHMEGRTRVVKQSAERFLETEKRKFHLVFLDPPYNKGLISPVMDKLPGLLHPGGIVVLESDSTDDHGEFSHFSVLKQRKYGRSYVTAYQMYKSEREDREI